MIIIIMAIWYDNAPHQNTTVLSDGSYVHTKKKIHTCTEDIKTIAVMSEGSYMYYRRYLNDIKTIAVMSEGGSYMYRRY